MTYAALDTAHAGRSAREDGRMNNRYHFYTNCVNWPRDDVHETGGLCSMIDEAHDVGRATFCRHVDRCEREDLERQLGYEINGRRGLLTMARDYHVSYHRSKLHNERVYFFKHSAIEYVFTRAKQAA